MSRTPQDVTAAEQSVLRVLWERQDATIRELTAELYPSATTAQYATVQKLLERLEAKGFVRHRRDQQVNRYAAGVEREALIGRRLEALAGQLADGSLAPLLMELVRAKKLTGDERRELRALLDGKRPGS